MNRFIVFEGVDGSGKSTQIKLLEEKLEQCSISYSTFREPGGNLLSEKIREILLDKDISICDESELMLFLAARGQNTEEGILKELSKGKFVICDRYSDSTMAYQGFGKELDKDFINSCNKFVTKGITPSITVILDISRNLSKNRDNSENDRMENNSNTFFMKVEEGYRKIAKAYPSRYLLIDGTLSIEQIHELIWSKFKKEFGL